MAKIFISHSSQNKEIVECCLEFLQMGMGISREEIFCTSLSGTLPTGEAFIEKIKEELRNCEAVIFLITEQYLSSQFCLAELGAAWGLSKRIYPLLLVDIEKIEKTPLKGLQALFLDREQDVSVIYDEFCSKGIIKTPRVNEFMKRLPGFISNIKERHGGEYLLKIASDGYYHTEISAVRSVPMEYRCYKIKGHLEDWEDKNAAKTDWIFFRTGMYDDLKIGDKIKFKTNKLKVSNWNDIGIARTIYPSDLKQED